MPNDRRAWLTVVHRVNGKRRQQPGAQAHANGDHHGQVIGRGSDLQLCRPNRFAVPLSLSASCGVWFIQSTTGRGKRRPKLTSAEHPNPRTGCRKANLGSGGAGSVVNILETYARPPQMTEGQRRPCGSNPARSLSRLVQPLGEGRAIGAYRWHAAAHAKSVGRALRLRLLCRSDLAPRRARRPGAG